MNEILLGSERRLHPLTMMYRAVTIMPNILIALFVFNSFEGKVEAYMTIIAAVLILPSFLLNYYFYTYVFTERELVIKSGVFSKNIRTIPLEKIQNIDIHQNALQRLLHIASAKVETAGGATTEAMLEYISLHESERLRTYIRTYKTQQLHELENIQINEESSHTEILFSMSRRDVLISGTMSFSLVFFAVFGIFFQYIPFLSQRYQEKLYSGDWLLGYSPSEILIGIVIASVGATILSWISGILVTFLRFYGFSLQRSGMRILVERGLFSKWRSSLSLKKFQMASIRSNPIMRYYNLIRMDVFTAASGGDRKRSETAVPMAAPDVVQQIAQDVFCVNIPDTFQQVSPISRRRIFFRYCTLFLTISAVGYLAIEWYSAFLVFPSIALSYWLAGIKYRIRGYTVSNEAASVRSGLFVHTICIVPHNKIQTLHIKRSLWQRVYGLATVALDTAAYEFSGKAQIPDVAYEDAEEILKTILHRAHYEKNKWRVDIDNDNSIANI